MSYPLSFISRFFTFRYGMVFFIPVIKAPHLFSFLLACFHGFGSTVYPCILEIVSIAVILVSCIRSTSTLLLLLFFSFSIGWQGVHAWSPVQSWGLPPPSSSTNFLSLFSCLNLAARIFRHMSGCVVSISMDTSPSNVLALLSSSWEQSHRICLMVSAASASQ